MGFGVHSAHIRFSSVGHRLCLGDATRSRVRARTVLFRQCRAVRPDCPSPRSVHSMVVGPRAHSALVRLVLVRVRCTLCSSVFARPDENR
jgi:hypothetical protein